MTRVDMKAATIAGPGKIEMTTLPIPEPRPGEVRVRLEGCGICASNIPVWEGREWFSYPVQPGAPGHEGWGEVDAVGDGVNTLRRGDRVTILSYNAFAEFDTAPAETVVRLPESLAGKPFPGEAIGCAMNVFRRADIEPGQTVAIVGVGFLGAILTRLASSAGARVIALSRREYPLEVASRFGAHELVQMDDHWKVIERIKNLTDGVFCDRVIEATGLQWPLDLAGELTRERGKLVVAGYHQDGPRQVNMQLWNWRGLDVINAHERDPRTYIRGIREAVEAVATGTLEIDPLFTHRFPLERLSEGYEAIMSRPDGFMKAVVTI